MEDKKSGLIRHLFGAERDRVITREDFQAIQNQLISDILYLEFCRHTPAATEGTSVTRISEVDFCTHLLYNSNLTPKRKARAMKRVEKAFKGQGKGISFTV